MQAATRIDTRKIGLKTKMCSPIWGSQQQESVMLSRYAAGLADDVVLCLAKLVSERDGLRGRRMLNFDPPTRGQRKGVLDNPAERIGDLEFAVKLTDAVSARFRRQLIRARSAMIHTKRSA